jgi:thiosulfate/3-mercaptopyruvate sulfurtransferase
MTSTPLISPEELAEQLGDPALRVADVRWTLGQPDRGRESYTAAHIPGAIFVDLDRDLAAAGMGLHPQGGRHPLPSPSDFAARMAAMGFGSEHRIVAYDDTGGTVAARLWWMLDDLGHADVRLLDGGLAAWNALGLPLTAEVAPVAPASMRLAGRWSRAIDRDALVSRLGDVRLLDVRAPERYRGEIEPVDRVPGHIPTAVSAPTMANLAPDGRFRPADELRQRYAAVILESQGAEVVASCGSGVNAAHTALAMRLAGLDAPLLYDGSYSDWSAAGLPVATGPEPGEMPEQGHPDRS